MCFIIIIVIVSIDQQTSSSLCLSFFLYLKKKNKRVNICIWCSDLEHRFIHSFCFNDDDDDNGLSSNLIVWAAALLYMLKLSKRTNRTNTKTSVGDVSLWRRIYESHHKNRTMNRDFVVVLRVKGFQTWRFWLSIFNYTVCVFVCYRRDKIDNSS